MKTLEKNRLREFRLSKGLTQVELAATAEVSLSTISWLENDTRNVSRRKKIKIASALGLPIDELFPERNSRGTAAMASDR